MTEQTKDAMIFLKSAKRINKDNNALMVGFTLTMEEIQKLFNAIEAINEDKVRMDVHIKPTTKNGRTFDTGFAFVKKVAEYNPNQQGGGRGQGRFVRKGSAQNAAARALGHTAE